MAITLEQFVNKIGFDFDDRGLRQANRSIDDFGKRLQSLGTTLSTRLTLPIVGFGALSVAAFNKQAQAVAQVEAAIASTGGTAGRTIEQLKELATSIQRNSLFGDEEVLRKVSANLLTFKDIAGDTFNRTQQAIVDVSARMGQDLQSTTIQLGKALNDPVANLGALSRTGIQFNDTQTDMIKNLVETNRLSEAQAIILDELESQFEGAAKAAADVGAGSFFQLMNTIGDLTEAIGEVIFETARLGDFFQWLGKRVEGLTRFIAQLNDWQKILIVAIPAIVAAAGPLLLFIGTAIRLVSLLNIALLPLYLKLLLIVAGVAAAFLIVQDLFSFLTGKESVIGTLIQFANELAAFILQQAVFVFTRLTFTIVNWIDKTVAMIKNAFVDAFDFIGQKADDLLSKIPILNRFFGNSDTNISSSAGADAVGAVSRSSSINVNSRISVGVPEGTPEEQQRAVRAAAEAGAASAFTDAVLAALNNNPEVE